MRRFHVRLGGRARLGLLVLAFVSLLTAWTLATQPFAGPDESSHYLRALEIANGHLLGPKANYRPLGLTPTELKFIDYDTRLVMVSRAMRPGNVACAGGVDLPKCYVATPNGNFPPLPYLLPAVALKLSNNSGTGLWLTRAASALPSLLLMVLAVALLWDGSALSELGLLAAVSPMVLFSASIMNSSGPEITACLVFGAAALRIARDPARAPAWVLASLAFGGCVAILSGPIGIVFIGGYALLGAALVGWGGLTTLWSTRRTAVIRVVASLALATVLAVIWRQVSGIAPSLFGLSPIVQNLKLGLDQLPFVLRDSLGTFGALTVPLPNAVYWLGWLFEIAIIATALWLGGRRDRLIVAVTVLLALAFPVLFVAFVDRLTGFGLQGREVLPVLMLIPLTAGEVIRRSERPPRARPLGTWVLCGALLAIAAFQGYAWWDNARVMAGAPGTLRFYAHALWSPPLGWGPWIALALLGVLSLVLFAVSEVAAEAGVDHQVAAQPA